ncbi:MAG: putative bifunctional diguanylate cyclase/phosphodiesterase, partial [Dehalococcoidia bacterium]
VDPTGRVVFVNHAAEGVGGYNRSEIIGSLFTDFLHPDERRAFTVNFRRAISSGEATPNEYRLLSKTGETLWFRTNGRPVFEDGRFVAFRGILTDITERKRAEDALRESEERFRTMGASAQDAIVMLDSDGKISFWNGAAKRIFGYSAAEAIGKHLHSLLVPERDRQASEEGFARFRATGRGPVVGTTVEFVAIKRDGTEFPIELSVASVKVRDEWSAIGIVRDVTERKRVEEAISHLAYHDALTGLPNRSLFVDRLTVALAQARRGKRMVAVMALDLDRFKVVNDTVGHAEGDQLLRQVGEQLAGLSRDGDTVARFGGDEFMVLLPQVSGMNDAIVVAERILEALREPKTLGGKEFRVTTSIGLAVYPGDGADADSLLRGADSALYRAKEEGRDNCQVCTPAIAAERQRRLSLEQDLRRALVLDEIAVHYQPMVDIETGEIMGLEALARWKHPKHGLLPPVEFIPVAEETGLIVPLGERVLQIAARQHRAWREKGLRPGRLAVNFSARQIRELSTVDLVVQTLEETGLDPQHLQVEITEQTAMQDVDVTLMILAEFKMAGIRIAVDDFGVGYSSLSYLTSLPVDFVKIDRSFVRDLTSDPADAAICASIIAMSHSLKLKVIAEGVETEEQLAFLRERGGDEFQGYLFSKPLPPSGITKMLQRGKRLPVLGGLAGAGPTASS